MAQQQTWYEWFWGMPAASSTTGTTSDPLPGSTSTASSSPYGPYVRTGRGGAGNFAWQSDQNARASSSDVEAHSSSALIEQATIAAESERHDTEAAMYKQQANTSEYVRVGRGYVERKELQAAAANADSASSTLLTKTATNATAAPEAPRGAYRGRGGAGNYAAAIEVSEKQKARKLQQESQAAEQRRDQIVQDIDGQLASPAEAWLSASKPSQGRPN